MAIPAPKIRYRISENTRKLLRFAVERMEEIHAASGAVRTFPVELWIDQPGHLMGTARMGHDPATSVVDSYGRAHDVPNLFLADGSIFVTSGSANPTCTISALALRVSGACRGNCERSEGERMTTSTPGGPPSRLSVPPKFAAPRQLTRR